MEWFICSHGRTGSDGTVFHFYEFFAGGGMARAGLGADWHCLFANDNDFKKSRTYERNWGEGVLKTTDVALLNTSDLPGQADLVWASFPCQDLSLAGGGAGLKGERSGTFWPFWDLTCDMVSEGRAPGAIVLENVCGTLSSHGGKDFAAICSALQEQGYRYGAVVVDAALFVPQSRPRLFIIGVRDWLELPPSLVGQPSATWHNRTVRRAHGRLPEELKASWIWWSLPVPPPRTMRFADLIEENPPSVDWHTVEETSRLLAMMAPLNKPFR